MVFLWVSLHLSLCAHASKILEKEMATHCSILGWKISCTEKAGGLQSMGPKRVGHDWATDQRQAGFKWGWGGHATEESTCSSSDFLYNIHLIKKKIAKYWKVVAEPRKTPGYLGSRGELSLGPVTRLDCSELLCNKVLTESVKEIKKASDIDIRRGQKECPLLVFSRMLYSY